MLFKPDANLRGEEIRRYLPVSVSVDFSNISPFISQAEIKYIQPLLGYTLHDLLTRFYVEESAPEEVGEHTGKYQELLVRVQRSLINLAYFEGFNFLNTSMTDSGLRREETESSKTLYKYQEEALRSQLRNNGFNGLDEVLTYLEAFPDAFPLFQQSTMYSIRKNSFIPSTSILNSMIDIGESRLVFIRISRFIETAEEFDVKALLGKTLYDKVKANLTATEPDPKLSALVPYVQKALAYLAYGQSISELGIEVTDKGLFFESQAATMQNSTVRTQLSESQSFALSRKATETGRRYLELLRDFLLRNSTDYPEFTGETGSPFNRDNSNKSTVWV